MKKVVQSIGHFNQKLNGLLDNAKIQGQTFKRIIPVLFFIIGIHAFYSHIGIYKYLDRRPCSVHSWAQCQRASVALNYYKEDMNFFKPRTQRYTKNGGITGLEFPIIYYSAAICYKLFGFREIFLRIISFGIITLGFFLFYLLTNKFLKNSVTSILVLGCAAASPVLLFYSPNFLPDAPSVGLVLMAWYFLFKHFETLKNRDFNLFVLCATLAALIKVVAIISLIICICLIILDRLKFFKTIHSDYIFNAPLKLLLKTILGMSLVVAWYIYANWLATHYENATFSLSPILPEPGVLQELVSGIKNWWLYQYYAYESYVLMIVALILIPILYKFANRLLVTITLLYILGSVCYVTLFLIQFANHDYYIISIIPAVFLLFLSFADAINSLAKRHFILVNFVFFIALFFNFKECLVKCKKNYKDRYSNTSLYWSYKERSFYDLEPKLRANGIQRKDVTLSAFDNTFCNTSYLMDQIGFTISENQNPETIKSLIALPEVKYLVLSDSAAFRKIYPYDLSEKIVVYHRGLLVYKLK